MARFFTSRYNFHIPTEEGDVLLYNASSGAVINFGGSDALALARTLSGGSAEVPGGSLPGEVCLQLRRGGFIIPAGTDELLEIRERFRRAREETPMVITLTTTMDCNLGCYYCYEDRSQDRLKIEDVPAIVALAEARLAENGKHALHVDWYGGEPLMNVEFMEAASAELQLLCRRLKVSYASSIISNGTCWPEDVGSFISRHQIRQAQISFDGLRANHDRRRRFRAGYATDDGASSFDLAVRLVDKLLDFVRVDVRINIDRANMADVLPFIMLARERGWFSRDYPAVIQPARLSAYSERSSFMRGSELSLDEYEQIRALVRDESGGSFSVEESESPDGFPYPRTSVCAALARASVVIGADGRQYRCGLQVSEPHRAVEGAIRRPRRQLPVLGQMSGGNKADELWWVDFDPSRLPNCSRCSFLPVCWGGCPKKHLEGDEHALHEQSLYWRRNLARLVASGVNRVAQAGYTFKESDQFR